MNFSLDNKIIFYHGSSKPRNGRLQVNTAQQFGLGIYLSTNKALVAEEFGDEVAEVKLSIVKPVYTGTNEWHAVQRLAIQKADIDYGRKRGLKLHTDDTYHRYDKTNLSEFYEIPAQFISEAAKALGYDAIIDRDSEDYENEICVLYESKLIYL